jgi:hypothetical protein
MNEYTVTIIYQTGEEFEEELYNADTYQAVTRTIEDAEQSPNVAGLNIKTITVNRVK